jgi:hypothetical protein
MCAETERNDKLQRHIQPNNTVFQIRLSYSRSKQQHNAITKQMYSSYGHEQMTMHTRRFRNERPHDSLSSAFKEFNLIERELKDEIHPHGMTYLNKYNLETINSRTVSQTIPNASRLINERRFNRKKNAPVKNRNTQCQLHGKSNTQVTCHVTPSLLLATQHIQDGQATRKSADHRMFHQLQPLSSIDTITAGRHASVYLVLEYIDLG